MASMQNSIIIKGARQHNLKNINLEIPRDKLIVITGLSGSGKSSLAFDTIYAEGQRRYVESLSAYARQFLEQMQKPEVESVTGLSPAISIDQKTTSRNPRSTVGTITEIYDYLRLLYTHIGKPHCPECGKLIQRQTASQIIDELLQLPFETKLSLLAPVIRGKKGEAKQLLEMVRKEGFLRVRVNGVMHDIEESITIDKNKKNTIEIVVDRLVIRPEDKTRLSDSVETSLKFGKGLVVALTDPKEMLYSENYACIECQINLPEISPRVFSFNAPYGACTECNGLGAKLEFAPELVFPDLTLPLRYASQKIINLDNTYFGMMVEAVARKYGFTLDTPMDQLTKEQRHFVLYGTGVQEVDGTWHLGKSGRSNFSGQINFSKPFEGIMGNLHRRYLETQSEPMRFHMRRFMKETVCSSCKGQRLKKEILAIRVQGINIAELTQKTIEEALQWFAALQLTEQEAHIAHELIKEISVRLSFLKNVGLDYIALNRKAATLSGGEAQRIRLATQIGSGLMGVLYVLDEPSIGLHQRDNQRLIQTLRKLCDTGNTVIVVEHDEETIRAADFVVDMGPAAGKYGGEVIFAGTVDQLLAFPYSMTAQYMNGQLKIELPHRIRLENSNVLAIFGAQENNLKNIDVEIPLSKLVCVTGVSGSGKSTLVHDILYKSVAQHFYNSVATPGKHRKITGFQHIDKVIIINQEAIGRTPRSNPATYTGVFDPIRELFVKTKESAIRGYKSGRFSFNVKGGRCETCEGDGLIKIEMNFLPDVYVTCEACHGKRYNRETLEVRFKGVSIADVLDMTALEAYEFFQHIPKISRVLKTLVDVGLGYIHLGQSATTLSGGEAQRIKLSSELCRRSTGKTLYILDEPTTGLHFADVSLLMEVLNRLVETGNTVLIIEHNLDVIRLSDYIIDLGPDGGNRGGQVIVHGSPEVVAKNKKSYTGQFLKTILQSHYGR